VELTPGGNGGDGAPGTGGVGGGAGDVIVTTSDNEDGFGFVVGGGLDVKLAESMSFGLEGLYYGFEGDGNRTGPDYFHEGDGKDQFVARGRITYHLRNGYQALK
jgi:opacity protein-like surface antigen